MSIEANHDVHVSTEAIEDLTAGAEMLAAAHATARDHHPGYSYRYATEIWCDSWVCGMVMTVPAGIDCGEAAAAIFEEHRAKEAEILLAKWRQEALEAQARDAEASRHDDGQ